MIRNRHHVVLLLVLFTLFVAACQGTAPPPLEDEPPTAEAVPTEDEPEDPPPAASPTPEPPPTDQPADIPTSEPPPTDEPALTPTTRPLPLLVVNGSQPQGTEDIAGLLTYDADFLLRIDARRAGAGDAPGAGIERVEFVIFSATYGEVYRHTEQNAAYCIFGGGEPDCNGWPLYDGVFRWGEGGPPVEPGSYSGQAAFFFTPESDDGSGTTEGFWSFEFELAAP